MLSAKNSDGYPSPVGLATDTVIITVHAGVPQVLLVRRVEEPRLGLWSLPGGFVGPDEGSRDTATRKLQEKAGVVDVYLEQLRTYDQPGRDERGWLPSVAYLALVQDGLTMAEDASWFPLDDLPELPFDHARMVADGIERLRGKLWYTPVAAGLLQPAFTIREARAVYEALLGQPLDPGNFSRRLRGSDLVMATGQSRGDGPGRPAATYRFAV